MQQMARGFRPVLGPVLVLAFLVVAGGAAAQTVLFSTSNRFAPGDSFGAGSRHSYEVRVSAGTRLEVVVASDAVDTYLEATLPDGEVITNDDYDGLNAGFLRTVTRTGTMRIDAQPLFGDGEGAYTVRITEAPSATELSVGSVVRGTLGGDGAGRAANHYVVPGAAGERITVALRSEDFDAYLEARDDTGRTFSDDDGGAAGYDSRLSYVFPEDGALQVTATSFGGRGTGDYELEVAGAGDELVTQMRGELVASDERAYDGKLVDRHEYEGAAGETVSVFLESANFDTMLYLSAPDGRNLASNDDGGGGTDSMVTLTLPTDGVYTLWVTSFFEGQGGYVLSVYR